MRALRQNCVVLDTSVLPKRPCIGEIKNLMDNKLLIDMAQVIYIQPHNVKNVVYLGMRTKEAASAVASEHHLKHFFEHEGKKIFLPIYVDGSAIDVRVHDAPFDMDDVGITNHMQHYGEVISVSREVWKSYFPGFVNGVRVVKMKLRVSIPSYINLDGEISLVTYQNQVKTCRNCGRPSHPKLRCSEAAAAENDNNGPNNTSTNDSNKNNVNNQQPNADTSSRNLWPELAKPATPNTDQHKNNKAEMKRQLSIDSDSSTNNATKKINVDVDIPNTSDSSVISVTSDICPYTGQPYGLLDFSHIEDPVERRAAIEEDKRKIDAHYIALAKYEQQKKKKKNKY